MEDSPGTKAAGLRRTGARALALAGGIALQASRHLNVQDGQPDLQGDRWVEWSFCLARLADGPGSTLDFGADIGFLALAAAQRDHDVVALDRQPSAPPDFVHDRVEFVEADILDRPLAGRIFDQIVNCSTIEHVGLAGRYGSNDDPNGDLTAMTILRELLAPQGRMIMTIPIGRDRICAPFHRIYGEERLPRLLAGYSVEEEQFWRKGSASVWIRTARASALQTEGSSSSYSLGLFVLDAT